MIDLPHTTEWQALTQHAALLKQLHLRHLFQNDPNRFHRFSCQHDEILLDFSKHLITEETLHLLSKLAQAVELPYQIEALFSGEPVNFTEQRAALHTALRADPKELTRELRDTLLPAYAKLESIAEALRQKRWYGATGKPITDIVNLGIGGSSIGPQFAIEALTPYIDTDLHFHFIDNIDGCSINYLLSRLNPQTTLFLVTSKSFTTQETLLNAHTAKRWLLHHLTDATDPIASHMIAVTAHPEKAQALGIPLDNILPIWEWVGGRYSIWSTVSLPLIIAIGMPRFQQFLAGARSMDQHFHQTPLTANLPALLGLLGVWSVNFLAATSHAIIPYYDYLRRLPIYLQQLEMESNGKRVNRNGEVVSYATAPVVWGGIGASSQHTFNQLLHQGTHCIPVDFIVVAKCANTLDAHHTALVANCFSQSLSLMQGRTANEVKHDLIKEGLSKETIAQLLPHRLLPGNRPSTTLLLPELSPYYLGALLALYEHKVFTQATIWQINPFDQWGVELGKLYSQELLHQLTNPSQKPQYDSSTNGLIDYFWQITHATKE